MNTLYNIRCAPPATKIELKVRNCSPCAKQTVAHWPNLAQTVLPIPADGGAAGSAAAQPSTSSSIPASTVTISLLSTKTAVTALPGSIQSTALGTGVIVNTAIGGFAFLVAISFLLLKRRRSKVRPTIYLTARWPRTSMVHTLPMDRRSPS